jgi:hypothetical protein
VKGVPPSIAEYSVGSKVSRMGLWSQPPGLPPEVSSVSKPSMYAQPPRLTPPSNASVKATARPSAGREHESEGADE